MKKRQYPLPYHLEYSQKNGCSWIGHPEIINSLKEFISTAKPFESHSLVLKDRPNLILETRLIEGGNFPWTVQVLKNFKWRGIQALIFSPLKKSKAMKSFSAACHLIEHGLKTPLPLAAYEFRRFGFIRKNIFVTEKISESSVLKKFIKLNRSNPDQTKEILKTLAEFALKMHDSGLWHRDMNLSNFLITGSSGNYKLYIIDLNRARIKDKLFIWNRALDLARLDLYDWQETFFKYYCKDRFDPQLMLKIANSARTRRSLWRKVAVRTIPLRQKLGLK
ncbi:MAG: lipopolysaccharide kinase InaA family protein [Desulfonatronovibrio sp.]